MYLYINININININIYIYMYTILPFGGGSEATSSGKAIPRDPCALLGFRGLGVQGLWVLRVRGFRS